MPSNPCYKRIRISRGFEKQLLAPHSQMTCKSMAPQEEWFRENWKKFISAMQDAESNPSQSQPVVAETADPVPAQLPAITVRAAGGVAPATQIEV